MFHLFLVSLLGSSLSQAEEPVFPQAHTRLKPVSWPLVNDRIATIPARVSGSAVVVSEGFRHKDGRVHFDTASLCELGHRSAMTMKTLLEN